MGIFFGTVIHGKKLGRTLGFPTANIALESEDLPTPATYGVMVTVLGQNYYGVGAFLGSTPVFEVHIFDFDGDIYDQRVSLEICFCIRKNRSFGSLHELKSQIAQDGLTMRCYIDRITHQKPVFTLALGGGAVRGLAHIGIIERLDEGGLSPIAVSGTSMGAIVAAFFALGYTGAEMRKIISEISLMQLIDFDFRQGLFRGKKVMKFLEQYFGSKTFADTKIPLVIVATNIETGEKVVFQSGKIIDAIRASISIPGVFSPYSYAGMELIDGGVSENLPISVLPPDIHTLAVSVQIPLNKWVKKTKKRSFFPTDTIISRSVFLLRKTISIMMTQNESYSLGLRKNITLLRPERADIDYFAYKKSIEMIDEGYRIGEGMSELLSSLLI